MADNTTLNPGTGGDVIASDEIGGVKFQRNKLIHGANGVNDGDVSTSNPLPVTLGLTDAQLRASAVPVSASALPLPSGAATEATLASIASTIANSNDVYTAGSPGQIILARRRDTDSSPAADGDLTVLNMDEEGRLKVASKPATYPDITGDITAIQATIGTPVAGGTVAGDVSRASNIMVFCTGTFAGVNCTFEGSMEASGDTNWFAVQAIRSNANTIELTTGVLAAQPAYAWELSVNALRRFRVRCTARTSGTQSWRFVQGTYATEPIPAAQVSATQPVSGTVTGGAGTALIGDVGLQVRANATGAASTSHLISAATTNTGNVKASAGRLLGWSSVNTTGVFQYVKLHNTAGTPTAGAGVVQTIAIPPNGVNNCPPTLPGIAFTTGIGRSIVTGSADTDATATTAGSVVLDLFFA